MRAAGTPEQLVLMQEGSLAEVKRTVAHTRLHVAQAEVGRSLDIGCTKHMTAEEYTGHLCNDRHMRM